MTLTTVLATYVKKWWSVLIVFMLDCKAFLLLRWNKGKVRDRFGLKVV